MKLRLGLNFEEVAIAPLSFYPLVTGSNLSSFRVKWQKSGPTKSAAINVHDAFLSSSLLDWDRVQPRGATDLE